MKHFFTIMLALLLLSCSKAENLPEKVMIEWDSPVSSSLAKKAFQYSKDHNLSQHYCIIVNYSIPSGYPRVFVYDFTKGETIYQGYTMHGTGKGSTDEKAVCSNEIGSHCSALGHFKITKRHGTINPNGFFLEGLDKANSNAAKRHLMIHDSYWVNTYAGYRKYIPCDDIICQGCVTTTIEDMEFIGSLVKSESKNILLWNLQSK